MKKILASSFTLIFIAISLFATAQNTGRKHKKKKHSELVESNKDMLGDLQGKWASLNDKKAFFVVREHDQQNFYADRVVDTTFINFYDNCPKRISVKDGLTISGKCMVIRDKDYKFSCYRIAKLNVHDLVLVSKENGKVLTYKKQYYR